METKKRYRILVSLLLAALLFLCGGLLAACGDKEEEEVVHGEEVGVFYYDEGGEEYLVSLLKDYRFTFSVRGAMGGGDYTLSDGAVTLNFTEGGLGTMTATLAGNVLTLNFRGSEMRFLKKVTFTVTFDSRGGSYVEPVKVINGKSLSRPETPIWGGHVFVAWYTDDRFTSTFRFDAQPVTEDITLYARWTDVQEGGSEYTVSFDAAGGGIFEDAETTGGVLSSVPEPEREGYTFLGWWISMYDDAAMLSYRYTAETVFREDTTLFALWRSNEATSKLPEPVVNVTSASVRWDDIPNKTAYELEITGPDGYSVHEPVLTANAYSINFNDAPAGDFVVRVKAYAGVAENDSEVCVRYYRNKVLPRVSHFTVTDGILSWEPVSGAEEYFVTAVCGNPAHAHTNLSVEKRTSYDFSSCEMKEGGIEFTVTAAAAGRASSTSRVFRYNRTLPEVSGFEVEDDVLRWDAVEGATGYLVTVTCGNAAHAHTAVEVSSPEYSLKECAPREGGILVSVTPKARGYNSPAASTYTYEKRSLATPSSVRIIGHDLCWEPVVNAVGYEVSVDGATFPANDTHLLLTGLVDWTKGQDYRICVRAVGEYDSAWSDPIDARYLALDATLGYAQGALSWRPVIGAEYYEVKVNGGSPVRVTGTFSADVTLTTEGDNELSVRFHDASGDSEWVSRTVHAYSVTFDTQSGTSVGTRYFAAGDILRLPVSERVGYDFAGWYDAPEGPEHNAARAAEEPFTAGKNLVLYAYWSPKTYELTLDYADGTGKTEKVYVTYSKRFTLPVPAATRPEDAFVGWYERVSGGGEKYAGENGEGLSVWDIPENVTVYAYWVTVLSFNYLENSGTYAATQGTGINLVTSVTVPSHYNGRLVSTLEGYAFRNCGYLEEVNLPNTMSVIETDTAFFNCNSLRAVNVYPVQGNREIRYSSSDGVLLDNNELSGSGFEVEFYPPAREGGFAVPSGVVNIPGGVFAGTRLTDITIPETVTYIAANAFYFCAQLSEVNFVDPKGEPAPLLIENLAFNNCIGLTEITLPARAVFNEEEGDISTVFNNCLALSSVHFESGNAWYTSRDGIVCDTTSTEIVYCPRGKSGSYTVPSGVLTIGERSFYRCLNLTAIVIPGFVRTVESYAFDGCSSLALVTFAAGGSSTDETVIGQNAFSGNGTLASVVFDEGSNVVEIGAAAFTQCRALTSFTVPGTVRKVDTGAFESCSSLSKVEFGEPVGSNTELTFGTWVFRGTVLKEIYLPSHATFTTSLFDGCYDLAFVKVAEGNPAYGSYADADGVYDGVLYNNGLTEVVYYPSAREGGYLLPATVTSIASNVFANKTNLTRIEIGYAVIKVGYQAFAGCTSLREVLFLENAPEGTVAEELVFEERNGESSAFARCTALERIVFPARARRLGGSILSFAGTYGSASANVLQSVTIPEGVEEIGASAFRNAALPSLTLPESMKIIGESAFRETSLTEINLPERLEQVGQEAFLRSALQHVAVPAGTVFGTGAFRECTALLSASFAAGRENVPESIFYGCTQLEEITLPAGLASIERDAFNGCTSLDGVVIPAAVKSIGNAAFKGCRTLSSLTIEEGETGLSLGASNTSSSEGVFSECVSLVEVALPARLSLLGGATFYGCSTLQRVTFGGSSIAAVYPYTFYGCRALSELTLPESVLSIGDSAFAGDTASGLTALHTLTLPRALRTIGASAFRYSGLTSVTFPASLVSIGSNAFAGNASLSAVTFLEGENAVTVSSGAFSESGVVTLTLSSNVTSLGDEAFAHAEKLERVTFAEDGRPLAIGKTKGQTFAYCTSLENIVLPDYVTSLAAETFRYSGLTGITLPQTLETVARGLLADTPLASVELPASVKTIGASAFENANLTKVNIPAGVTSLGASSFAGNTSLASVTFAQQAELLTIGDYAFRGTALSSVRLPAKLENVTTAAFEDCAGLASIEVEEGSEHFAAEEGILYNFGKTELILCPAAKEGSVTLPSGLLTVRSGSFKGSVLDTVTLPSSVTTVGESAFAGAKVGTVLFANGGQEPLTLGERAFGASGLVSLTLPDRAVTIGGAAFSGCESLASVTFAENVRASIGERAFENCTSLSEVDFRSLVTTVGESAFAGCSELLSVQFTGVGGEGDSLTIEKSAFDGLGSLTSVTFPAYTTYIGEGAFRATALDEVFFPTSVAEIGESAFYGCASLIQISFAEDTALAEIAKQAFRASALASLELPASLREIGEYAFGDTQITSVTFAANGALSSIGNSAFRNTKIEALAVPASVTALGAYSFAETPIEELTLAEGLETIGNYAFYNCASLASVRLPATVLAAGEYAFAGTSRMTSFTFAEGTTAERPALTLGAHLFDGAGLTSFEVPVRAYTLGEYLFNNAAELFTLTFAAGCKVTTIPDHAFAGTAIEELVLPDSVTNFAYTYDSNAWGGRSQASGAFFGLTTLRSITLPAFLNASAIKTDPPAMFTNNEQVSISTFRDCKNLAEILVPENSNHFSSKDGVLYDKSGNTLLMYPMGKGGSYDIPEGTRGLGESAFAFTSVEAVNIPASLTTINNFVFALSSLSSITFTDGGRDALTFNVSNSWYAPFRYCYNLKSIEIPARLEKLGDSTFSNSGLETVTFAPNSRATALTNAFSGNHYLRSIELPSTITTIERSLLGPFYGCDALEEVELAEGFDEIPDSMFMGCTSLTRVNIPKSVVKIGGSAFQNTAITEAIIPGGVTSIGVNAFTNCKQLKTVTFEHGTAPLEIGASDGSTEEFGYSTRGDAFSGCESLERIEIPARTSVLHTGAFSGCKGLLEATFEAGCQITLLGSPDDGSTFGRGAVFRDCSSLTSIELPDTITVIEDDSFRGCTGLSSVKLPFSLTSIGKAAFKDTALTQVRLERNVSSIGDEAFQGCTELEEAAFSTGLAYIGDHAFDGCVKLRDCDFKQAVGLVTIGDYAFRGCGKLSEILLPNNVREIGDYAFDGCTSVGGIELPVGLVTIGIEAFDGCTQVPEVVIPGTVTRIGEHAFRGVQTLKLEPTNTSYAFEDGVLYTGDLTTIHTFPTRFATEENGGVYVVPDYVTTIPSYAFENSDVVEIRVSAYVTSIASYAFANAHKLQKVTLACRISSLPEGAFYGCEALEEVELPVSLLRISEGAFEGCSSLTTLTLPANIQGAEAGAFAGWTAAQTIVVPFREDDIPAGFEEGWSGDAAVEYKKDAEEGASV